MSNPIYREAFTCEVCLSLFHAARWDAKLCSPRCRKVKSRRALTRAAKKTRKTSLVAQSDTLTKKLGKLA